jgi:hypothetical protein
LVEIVLPVEVDKIDIDDDSLCLVAFLKTVVQGAYLADGNSGKRQFDRIRRQFPSEEIHFEVLGHRRPDERHVIVVVFDNACVEEAASAPETYFVVISVPNEGIFAVRGEHAKGQRQSEDKNEDKKPFSSVKHSECLLKPVLKVKVDKRTGFGEMDNRREKKQRRDDSGFCGPLKIVPHFDGIFAAKDH